MSTARMRHACARARTTSLTCGRMHSQPGRATRAKGPVSARATLRGRRAMMAESTDVAARLITHKATRRPPGRPQETGLRSRGAHIGACSPRTRPRTACSMVSTPDAPPHLMQVFFSDHRAHSVARGRRGTAFRCCASQWTEGRIVGAFYAGTGMVDIVAKAGAPHTCAVPTSKRTCTLQAVPAIRTPTQAQRSGLLVCCSDPRQPAREQRCGRARTELVSQ